MNIKRMIAKNYVNFRGWNTKRRFIIIESDDWGSVRMPSKKIYQELLKKEIHVDRSYFTKYDCLESNDDLELLFDVLSSYKDIKGNNPVITALSLMVNPDFEKIKLSNKNSYSYELISETYKNYPNHNRVLEMWKNEGIDKNLLYPQFHGREHLNVRKWMRVLNANIEIENISFDKHVLLGIGNPGLKRDTLNYTAAFEYEDDNHKKEIEVIAKNGLNLFKDVFGFESKSFAASGSIRGDHLDKVLSENGVKYHQLGQQFIPQPDGNLKIYNRFWGDTNKYGQTYWRRNATFEPSRSPNEDWVDKCLSDIKVAFRWGKPAVINSHRVNFSGGIDESNRDNTLKTLHELLKKILNIWPDVEFINSEQLGDIITKKS